MNVVARFDNLHLIDNLTKSYTAPAGPARRGLVSKVPLRDGRSGSPEVRGWRPQPARGAPRAGQRSDMGGPVRRECWQAAAETVLSGPALSIYALSYWAGASCPPSAQGPVDIHGCKKCGTKSGSGSGSAGGPPGPFGHEPEFIQHGASEIGVISWKDSSVNQFPA